MRAALALAGAALLATAAAAQTPLLDARWDLDGHERADEFFPRAYKPVYLLPATHTDNLNLRPSSPSAERSATEDQVLRRIEAKYQLSFKSKFLGGLPFGMSVWGGYTQSSRWQVYNGAVSRPFRETNYEPEVIAVLPLQQPLLGGTLRMASLAINHQSNGRSLPFSRSWNRWIAGLAWERDDWTVELRPWWRLPEAAAEDDNPDIRDHIGRGELLVSRHWGNHALHLQLRHSARRGERSRGSAQLEYAFPLRGAMHGWLQVFSGYGESMVDYNVRQNKVGLGVTIAGWR